MRLSPFAFVYSAISNANTPNSKNLNSPNVVPGSPRVNSLGAFGSGSLGTKAAFIAHSRPSTMSRTRTDHSLMRTHRGFATSLLAKAQSADDHQDQSVWIDPDFISDTKSKSQEPEFKKVEEHPPMDALPPRNPRAWTYTQSILTLLDVGEQFAPGLMDRFFDGLKAILRDNTKEGSFIAQGLTQLIDTLEDRSDLDSRREYLYLLLVSTEIINETCQQRIDSEGNVLPNDDSVVAPLIQSLLFGQLDSVLSEPTKLDPFGVLKLYDSLLNSVIGDRKTIAYDAIASLKDRLLDTIKKEDPNSLTAKVTTALYLLVSIDTGQDISVDEIAQSIQELGIPAVKLSQTVAGLIKTVAGVIFGKEVAEKDESLNRLVAACEKLQEYCAPMSQDEAEAQMKSQHGDDWRDKLCVDINLSKVFRSASIACTYVGTKKSNGQKVFLKIQRPNLKEQLKRDRAQSQQLLRALYRLLEEAKYAEIRAGKTLSPLLSQAGLFEKSEQATNEFFELFDYERDFVAEALALERSSCLTPKVYARGPVAILMEFVDNALKPSKYLELSLKSQEVNYKTAHTPTEAAQLWLKKHSPLPLDPKEGIQYFEQAEKVKVSFEDKHFQDLWLDVSGSAKAWRVSPITPFIDFSRSAREKVAMQFLIDLVKQLSDGAVNADAHGGNFLVAPSAEVDKNKVYNFDFGLMSKISEAEGKIVSSFFKGIITSNVKDVARAYLSMSKNGRQAIDSNHEKFDQFVKVLKEAQYLKQLFVDPNAAMGPVMTWLSENNLSPDGGYYGFIRAFAGVASNTAAMLNKDRPSASQINYLAGSLGEIFLDKKLVPWLKERRDEVLGKKAE